MSDRKEEEGLDPFELVTAIVIGLGAIGGAWASFQSGLWGGNQATAYGEAGNMMSEAAAIVTQAANKASEASMQGNRDADIDLQVKRLVFEGQQAGDAELNKRNLLLAKYLYQDQLSDEANDYLGLPDKPKFEDITDEELLAANKKSLDDKYFDDLYDESEKEYERAAKKQQEARDRFFEGQQANYYGDVLGLSGVFYTVCLFLSGISLVFKSRVKWIFGGLGVLALIASSIHMIRAPWTSVEAPKLEAPASAKPAAGSAAPAASPK